MLHPNSKQDEKHNRLNVSMVVPQELQGLYRCTVHTIFSQRQKDWNACDLHTDAFTQRWLNCFHQIVGKFQLLRERCFLI